MSPVSRLSVAIFVCVAFLATAPAGATTVQLQPSSQDSFLRHENPNTPSGSGPANTRIRVRSDGSGNPQATIWRGILQFDLSTVPQFATVSAATLELYEGNTGTTRTYGVHRVNDPWLQATVKWNTQPSFAVAATSTNTVGDAPRDFRAFNVLADVQAWVNAPATNHGWILKDEAETSGSENINFLSMEDTTDLPHRPRLTITYAAPSCSTNAQCADTNACTVNERCVGGFCVVDARSCDDSNVCTDDLCDPNAGCINTVGECNDGFDCTIDGCSPTTGCFHTVVPSVCTEGGCRTGTCVADPNDATLDPLTGCTVTSQQPDGATCQPDASTCTSDLCASGHCTHPNLPSGTPCSDGNACTQSDTCNSTGGCVPGTPTVCTALDQCHVAGVCSPSTGVCSNPNATNGTPCTDGSACTQLDACSAGACVGGSPVVCTPLDQCHLTGTCNPQTGVCSSPLANDGTACSDGNGCTQTDRCTGGTCIGSNPVVCPPPGPCHVAGTCNPTTGLCSNPNRPDGTSCDDGDACTQTDVCTAGSCVGGNPVLCPLPSSCTLASVCDPQNGTCSAQQVAPDGTSCDDGQACTFGDHCTAGVCGGTSAACGDGILQPDCNEECDPPSPDPDCTATCQYLCGPLRNDCKRSTELGKALLQIRDAGVDSKDRFSWKWLKGSATTAAEFGDPPGGSEYLVCVYDQGPGPQPVMRMLVPGGVGWRTLPGGTGFLRKNTAPFSPDGDQITLLKAGAQGKSKLQVKGLGERLPLPALPLTGTVTVQLKNGAGASGGCWAANFSNPVVNTTAQFKAKGN